MARRAQTTAPTPRRGRSPRPAEPPEEQALALTADDAAAYAEDAGAGLENVTADCFQVPFLKVLQQLSPACSTRDGVEGAEPGMLYNTATQTLWDVEVTPAQFIPCYFRHEFLRFGPTRKDTFREKYTNREFKDLRAAGEVRRLGKKNAWRFRDASGEFTEDTSDRGFEAHTYYGLIQHPERPDKWEPVAFSLRSTQLRKSSAILMALEDQTIPNPAGTGVLKLPVYASVFEFSTQVESNDEGEWYGLVPRWARRLGPKDLLYAAGKAFHSQVAEGAAEANYAAADDADHGDLPDEGF